MLLKMVSLLEIPDNDYWYDVGCSEARSYLDSDDKILFLLTEKWRELSLLAQEHLAYILGEGHSENELLIINEMLKSGSKEIVFRAQEALIEFKRGT